jgi:acyl-CoA synthetase (AMP-forming)/AMP-acid ligase II
VPPQTAEQWRAAGFWDDRSLGELVSSHVAEHPDQTITVHSLTRPSRVSYAELAVEARRLAAGFAARGIGAGDVVACQLPNWREAIAVIWAANFLGAVIAPIVHFYGRREVDFVLERTDVRAFVCAASFGRMSYLDDAGDRPALAALDVLAVVGDGPLPPGAIGYDELLAADPLVGVAEVDPDAPALVAYTSGTTSEPKGVIHSHRTIGAEIRQLTGLVPALPPRLRSSPIGHIGGMLTSVYAPVAQGGPIDIIDVWDPDRVIDLMTEHGLASGSGATFFLTSLLDHPRLTAQHLELMHEVSLGGAPVPEAVALRADALGLSLTRNYGATEHPTITGSRHGDPADARLRTDGRAMPGVQIRIVADDGTELPPGSAGEILSRGPDCFVGYTDPTLTDQALDADGWYHTGDIGVLDGQGYLTITDRKKDIIIRGGENISAAELEQVLMGLPVLAEVAVVGAPDARYGEHACAFVRLRDDTTDLTLDALRAAAAAGGLGRQKWPEELRIVTDFPRTPSGKISKRELRDQLRQS